MLKIAPRRRPPLPYKAHHVLTRNGPAYIPNVYKGSLIWNEEVTSCVDGSLYP